MLDASVPVSSARIVKASVIGNSKQDTARPIIVALKKMDIIERQQGITAEVENLAKEKSSLEAIVADMSLELDDTLRKLQISDSALAIERNEKLEKEKERDDAIRILSSMLNEKLEMQKQMDKATKEAEELRRQEAGIDFSAGEVEQATNNFDLNLRRGQGGTGTVFKGRISQTTVAIKKLNVERLQCGHSLYDELKCIYRVKHPHIVTLIGACSQPLILVYEYLANGNLNDQLNGSPPLSWKTRIRIAAEICDALLFLHFAGYLSGNLKPNNILLDENLRVKLDLGFCAPIKRSSDPTDWDPMGALYYTDPETRSTGKFTKKSWVYSFGLILLELLTGSPGVLVPTSSQGEVDAERLQEVLDHSAGAWPFIQALQLANLGLRCCSESAESRPDLQSEVWRVLDTMRSSASSSTTVYGPDGSRRLPDYFMCPITQEIMTDPHVAADGYTYEEEALKGWLDGGHTTSPMTNLPLSHHNLTPNHALRSAIHEWRQGRS